MTTQRQTPVAEAAERSHLALRRAVVDVAVSLLRAGVLSCSGHAHLSTRVGPDSVLITTLSQMRDLGPDDLAVIRLDGTVIDGDLAEMSTEMVAIHTRRFPRSSRATEVGLRAGPAMHILGMVAEGQCATVA